MGRVRRKNTEHAIQAGYMEWVTIMARTDWRYLNIWANPNAGKRGPRAAWLLKREGMKRGVPDITVAIQTPHAAGLYLEFKSEKGKPTKEQIEFLQRLNKAGYIAIIVRTLTEAMEITKDHMSYAAT